ncbi:3-dehydroquinate synthase [bacterium]|nr:3-dehydroquinate synthase [bacterium]
MKTVNVRLPGRGYPILIQAGSLDDAGRRVRRACAPDRLFIITDATVGSLYGDRLLDAFRRSGITASLHAVPAGENSKSWRILQDLYTRLIESGLTRDSCVAALGGGVVGDLAGFAAATYLRGIAWVQIPTTLLAQVDSSVGGKTGINHELGKNLIGSFHQPRLVLMDPSVLTTLEKREYWAGMSEVVKYGLIRSEPFFAWLESKWEGLGDPANAGLIEQMVTVCCRIKADVVRRDEKESGLRRILNFGHTLGHALESATEYGLFRHGEAVLHGMRFAAWLSMKREHLKPDAYQRIDDLLKRFPAPPVPNGLDGATLYEHMRTDKKRTGQGLRFILLKGIGKAFTEIPDHPARHLEEWLTNAR